jgi:MraZ protein
MAPRRKILRENAKKWDEVVESGKKCVCLFKEQPLRPMTFFTSEYESKLDAKGRLVLPARIKAQLPEGDTELVLRKGFEPCLIVYPITEFRKVFARISGLSEFNEEYRQLQRNFFSGTATVELDGHGRILIPKNMLAYAGIEREVVLVGMGNKVEVWNPEQYQKYLIQSPEELSRLAQKHLES